MKDQQNKPRSLFDTSYTNERLECTESKNIIFRLVERENQVTQQLYVEETTVLCCSRDRLRASTK